MSTQFNGTAEDIQHKLIAGKGVTISDTHQISTVGLCANPDLATADGMYFIPASTYTMPDGYKGCAILLVATGDVGGGSGVRQFILLENAIYRRYRFSTGIWSSWRSGDLGTLLGGNKVDGLQLSHNDFTNADKALVGALLVEDDGGCSYTARLKLIGGKPVIEYEETE